MSTQELAPVTNGTRVGSAPTTTLSAGQTGGSQPAPTRGKTSIADVVVCGHSTRRSVRNRPAGLNST